MISIHVIHAFLTGERTPEGFFRTKPGIDQAIARGLAYAPYADLIWCETSHPSLEEAQKFADAIHAEVPWKNASLQLFTIFQLGSKLRPRNDCKIPSGARENGLQIPIRNTCWIPFIKPQHVRISA